MADALGDIFGAKAKPIPHGDPLHGDAGPDEVRPSPSNIRRADNHRTNVGRNGHGMFSLSAVQEVVDDHVEVYFLPPEH